MTFFTNNRTDMKIDEPHATRILKNFIPRPMGHQRRYSKAMGSLLYITWASFAIFNPSNFMVKYTISLFHGYNSPPPKLPYHNATGPV